MGNLKYGVVHIPKTGGTTIVNYLKLFYSDVLHKDQTLPSDVDQYSIVFGHLNPRLLSDRKKIVWLRNPVDRVVSNYLHWKWRLENSPKKFIIIDDKTRRFPINMNIVDFSLHTRHVYKFFTNNYNLDDFWYVGFCENMNTHLERLCNLLNIDFSDDKIGHYRKNQKTGVEVSNDELEEMKIILREDILFYERAREQWDVE